MKYNIEKKSRELRKALNDSVTIASVADYLLSLGYNTVFFNTCDGDELLKAYGLLDIANQHGAFTYCGVVTIVFVDNELSAQSKLHLMLHELGHILLNHLDDKMQYRDKIQLDNEAEAFAFFVLRPPKKAKIIYIVNLLIVFTLLVFHSMFVYTDGDEVFITSQGNSYHREYCIKIKAYDCISIPKYKADKLYTPCRLCNP